jgi:Tfp pilus assembly protein PilV
MKMEYIKKLNNNQRGIGIVEVIAALGLAIIVLTALVSLSLFTIRSSLQSKLMLEGTKLANKELELVRALRDSSAEWENGSTGFLDRMIPCDTGCYMNNLVVVSGSDTTGTGPEAITKSFRATDIDGNQLTSGEEIVRISVEIAWNVGTDTKYARLYTDLTNWANR